jgi:hypothetical protein
MIVANVLKPKLALPAPMTTILVTGMKLFPFRIEMWL